MPPGDIFAGNTAYFQGLQQERTRQAYLRQLQRQQNLKTAMEALKASRTNQAKPIWDAKRGVIIDPNTGQVTTPQGLPVAPPSSGKTLNSDYARAMAENGINDVSKVTPMMLFKAHQANQREQSGLIAGRTPPQIVEKLGYDELGRPLQTPYRVPKRGGEATPVFAEAPGGAAPMTMKKAPTGGEGKVIATVQGIIPQLQDVRSNLEAIGPEKWNRNVLTRQLDYQRAKHLNILPDDPQMAALTSQLIQVEASAQAALLASAGTRAMSFIQNSKGHIPTAYGDYNSIMANINTLTGPNGPYSSLLKSYELSGGGAEASTKSSPKGTVQIKSKSGRAIYKDPSGQWRYAD